VTSRARVGSPPILIGLLLAIFFAISLVTNILGPLIPDIIRGFSLSLSMAAFLPFSFFLAYGVCSIPAGFLVERYREKTVVLFAFGLVLLGALSFAFFHTYTVAIGSLFTIGLGMALLQVAINPLLRAVVGDQRFAFYSVLGQLVFGFASFVSPFVYAHMAARRPEDPLSWVAVYWVFVATALVMIALVALAEFPTARRTEEETAGSARTYLALLRRPRVVAYFAGVFAYVGTEQGVATWMSEFLQRYHGLSPQRQGAQAVAWFWGLMTAGCALGLVLLKFVDPRKVLAASVLLAMVCLTLALTATASIAPWAFSLVGFAASVMWSIVFSLALGSVAEHHGALSGILCTAIVGGAVVPYLVGAIGDRVGLRAGMLVLYVTLGYILGVAWWSRPALATEPNA
jgi:fucose permease